MFIHTRKKHWESGRFYLIPTIRIEWHEETEYDFKTNVFVPKKHFSLEFVWFTFILSIP